MGAKTHDRWRPKPLDRSIPEEELMQDQKKDIIKEGSRTSTLSKGRERFLAHVIEHGFEVGRRSPEDFVRHFPPTLIMEGLRDQAKLRANILVAATGLKEKVAIKKK